MGRGGYEFTKLSQIIVFVFWEQIGALPRCGDCWQLGMAIFGDLCRRQKKEATGRSDSPIHNRPVLQRLAVFQPIQWNLVNQIVSFK